MNEVEKVKKICKERNIPISKVEAECGFANGYIGQLKKGTFPSDRLIKIANYLGVTLGELSETAASMDGMVTPQSERKPVEWLTDTRPEEAGFYLVTLETELGEWDHIADAFVPNGTIERFVDVRYYARPNEFEEWAMEGEDPDKMHWTEQYGSAYGERVVAWADRSLLAPFRGGTEAGKKYVYIDERYQQPPDKLRGR